MARGEYAEPQRCAPSRAVGAAPRSARRSASPGTGDGTGRARRAAAPRALREPRHDAQRRSTSATRPPMRVDGEHRPPAEDVHRGAPPMIGPRPVPMPAEMPQMPIARARSRGSGYRFATIERLVGVSAVPPIACRTRNASQPAAARRQRACDRPGGEQRVAGAEQALRPNRSARKPALSRRLAPTRL